MNSPSPTTGPVGVGIIGAGTIAAQYLEHLGSFPDIDVRAIGDIFPEASAARAEEFGVPGHGDVDTVLQDPGVEIVVNLTIPAAHFEVSERILRAGKHVWTEKPLTTDRESATALLELAAGEGLRIGGAPDTVLGAGVQSALRALADGEIGDPRFALALFRSRGPESWHPNPAFLFTPGGGPLFDMGPYYMTSLVLAQGPVASVRAVSTIALDQREIGSGPKAGESFDVTVPTQVSALLTFASGATATAVFSFDTGADYPPELELHGSLGSIRMPDPNTFSGVSRVAIRTEDGWQERVARGAEAGRGLGTLEMARAIRADRPHRLTGELAAHVLDILVSIDEAAASGTVVPLASTTGTVEPLPADFDPYTSTL